LAFFYFPADFYLAATFLTFGAFLAGVEAAGWATATAGY